MIGGKLTEFLEIVTLVVNYSHVVTTPNYEKSCDFCCDPRRTLSVLYCPTWKKSMESNVTGLIWFMPKGCLDATTERKKKKKNFSVRYEKDA